METVADHQPPALVIQLAGVGVAAASAVISAFALGRLVFAPASGAVVNRLGERPTYLIGLFVVALSSAATAFAAEEPVTPIEPRLSG